MPPLRWPYDCDSIKNLITIITEAEPYSLRTGVNKIGGRNGENALKCGEHVLDINFFTYLWDKKEVVVPAKRIVSDVGGDVVSVDKGSNCAKTGGNATRAASGGKNSGVTLYLSFAFAISFGINLYFLFTNRKRRRK